MMRDLCTDPNCIGNIEGREHGHLSMDDPPGMTRLDLIAMILNGEGVNINADQQ